MNENVVIIEDDPGVRFFLEEALKGEKYSVSSFASYEEAANAIDKIYRPCYHGYKPSGDGWSIGDERLKTKNRCSDPHYHCLWNEEKCP